jgi:pyruvate ferredoxin oxidoreductase alpha subunit
VLEKSMAVGLGGVVSDGIRKALSGISLHGHTVIAGLGGRAVPKKSLVDLIERAAAGELSALNFLDLNWGVVKRELSRQGSQRRAGPAAEAILKDVGRGMPPRGQDLYPGAKIG